MDSTKYDLPDIHILMRLVICQSRFQLTRILGILCAKNKYSCIGTTTYFTCMMNCAAYVPVIIELSPDAKSATPNRIELALPNTLLIEAER